MNVIETRSLSKSYDGVLALSDLDLTVRPNSIFGFLGPNGAGKSTTMKLLLGLARPTSGSARLFGLDSVRDSLAIRRRVGYLAQDPRFYDHLSARETLRFVARFFDDDPTRVERRVDAALELVGLTRNADRSIRGFSGGERQRLGLAQAQIAEPDLLILDEPAASLDPMGRRDVLEIMAALKERATVFYSTHILDDVQRVSDEVAILRSGQLVAQAPLRSLLAGGHGIAYELTTKGDTTEARAELARRAWVASIDGGTEGEQGTWHVGVTDADAAEAELLRVVLQDPGVSVTGFRRKTFELEDAFLDLVDGPPVSDAAEAPRPDGKGRHDRR
jgi:ABC-2 type transport system ATP-binding protein